MSGAEGVQPFSLAAKSARMSGILICWGHTASQLRQPTQEEGCLSAGRAWRAMGGEEAAAGEGVLVIELHEQGDVQAHGQWEVQ